MSESLATCFITRYQHDKLYVDIAVEAAADHRRRHVPDATTSTTSTSPTLLA